MKELAVRSSTITAIQCTDDEENCMVVVVARKQHVGDDVVRLMTEYLPVADILNCRLVCSQWARQDALVWRRLACTIGRAHGEVRTAVLWERLKTAACNAVGGVLALGGSALCIRLAVKVIVPATMGFCGFGLLCVAGSKTDDSGEELVFIPILLMLGQVHLVAALILRECCPDTLKVLAPVLCILAIRATIKAIVPIALFGVAWSVFGTGMVLFYQEMDESVARLPSFKGMRKQAFLEYNAAGNDFVFVDEDILQEAFLEYNAAGNDFVFVDEDILQEAFLEYNAAGNDFVFVDEDILQEMGEEIMDPHRIAHIQVSLAEVAHLIGENPGCVPIRCVRAANCDESYPRLNNEEFPAPKDMPLSCLNEQIRQRLQLQADSPLSVYVESPIPLPASELLEEIHATCRANDGYLHLRYSHISEAAR